MATVMIATPHGGKVPPDYYRHVLVMQGAWTQHTFRHAEVDMMIIGKARNMLVEMALTQDDVDVVWFIDDDTLVPPHAGKLIDEAMDLGIVSGLYFSRRPPYTPQMYRAALEPNLKGMYWPIIEYPDTGLMVVDAVGGGCVAIRRDVLIQMKAYFDTRKERAFGNVNKALANGRGSDFEFLVRYAMNLSPWFEFLDRKGEDMYFCERAKDADNVIWLDLDVKCGHLGEMPIEEPHFNFLMEQGLIKFVPSDTPDAGGVMQAVIADQPQGDAPLENRGVEPDEYPDGYFTRTETMERDDDLPRTARRIGVSVNLSGA